VKGALADRDVFPDGARRQAHLESGKASLMDGHQSCSPSHPRSGTPTSSRPRFPSHQPAGDAVWIVCGRKHCRDGPTTLLHPGWQTGPKPRSGPVYRSGAWCITDTFSESRELLSGDVQSIAARIHFLTGQVAKLDPELVELVKAHPAGPTLLSELGVGPVVAAQLLVSWSHRGRVRSEAA
jgi:hypothetical protein